MSTLVFRHDVVSGEASVAHKEINVINPPTIHTPTHKHNYIPPSTHTHTHTHTAKVRPPSHTHTHTNTHTHKRSHTNRYTHTHTHTHSPRWSPPEDQSLSCQHQLQQASLSANVTQIYAHRLTPPTPTY